MWAVIGIYDLPKSPRRISCAGRRVGAAGRAPAFATALVLAAAMLVLSFASGAATRATGAATRATGAATLTTGGATLPTSVATLNTGGATLTTSVATFTTGAATFTTGAALTTGQTPQPGPRPIAGWLGVWLGTGLAVLAVGLALATVGRWIRRFALRDLVLVALTTGMAFLLVTIPGFMMRSVAAVLLGPFSFFVEGLIFKLVLFVLLGALFALVRRPGVFFLFFGLWTVAQALLNGHYSPMMVLFSCSTIFVIEIALWLSGITRPTDGQGPPPWLSGALVVGLAEGFTVFWSLNLIVVLFRVYLAEWFVLLEAGTEAVYAGLGLALGLRMGMQLRRMRRPAVEFVLPLPEADQEPAHPPRSRNESPDPSDSPLLQVENLTFAYPGEDGPALNGVSLRVHAGEIVLLAGASGAGKTTLLRLIQGLLPWPGGAALRFSGEDGAVLTPPLRALRSGLLFQEPALQVVRSTVAAEVAFGHQVLPGRTAQGDSGLGAGPTRQALEMFGLAGLAGRSTHTLSGGELQLTALAGVVATGAPLLLLDEPLANLDKAGRAALVNHLRHLAGRGLGIVVAEHRLEPLLPLARQVLWLTPEGAIRQGSPAAHPATSAAPLRQPGHLPCPVSPPEAGRVAGSMALAENTARVAGSVAPAEDIAPAEYAAREALVQCRNVGFTHSQAQAPVLRGLHAALYPGQAVALSGANGTGKTTLLSLILGLAKPGQGSVTVRGRAAHRLSWKAKSRLFGYLPQQAELLLQAPTVAEELAFALRCQGRSPEFIESETAVWLQRLQLQPMAGRAPHLLSRGEKQRLALGAVMIGNPGMLVLDEPFAGQDAMQVESILGLCGAYMAGSPRPESPPRGLLVTTHDLEPARGFFHAEWHLADGRIATVDATADDRPVELQPRPLAAMEGGA